MKGGISLHISLNLMTKDMICFLCLFLYSFKVQMLKNSHVLRFTVFLLCAPLHTQKRQIETTEQIQTVLKQQESDNVNNRPISSPLVFIIITGWQINRTITIEKILV